LYYLTPKDFLLGIEKERVTEREEKYHQAAINRVEY